MTYYFYKQSSIPWQFRSGGQLRPCRGLISQCAAKYSSLGSVDICLSAEMKYRESDGNVCSLLKYSFNKFKFDNFAHEHEPETAVSTTKLFWISYTNHGKTLMGCKEIHEKLLRKTRIIYRHVQRIPRCDDALSLCGRSAHALCNTMSRKISTSQR